MATEDVPDGAGGDSLLILEDATVKIIKEGNQSEFHNWLCGITVSKFDKILDATESWTALHHAAFHGQIQIMQYVLDYCASFNSDIGLHLKSKHGKTVFDCAMDAVKNHDDGFFFSFVELLLQFRINVKYPGECSGNSLLEKVYFNDVEAAKDQMDILKCAGKKVTGYIALAARNDRRMLEMMLDYIKTPSDLDGRCGPYAPLHIAVLHQKEECVKLLLEHGADPYIVDDSGRYPIHCAIEATKAEHFLMLVSCFSLTDRPSINKKTNGHGHTLLHLAVINGKQDFVTILVMLGADPDLPDEQGRCPIHYLCETPWNMELIQQLSGSIRFCDTKGHAPVHIAIQQNDLKLARALFKMHGRVVPRDFMSRDNGRHCLHFATLAKGSDVDFEKMIALIKGFVEQIDDKAINYDFKTISDLKKVAIQQVYCDTIANLLQELINPVHDQYLSKYLKQIVEKFDEERAVDYEKIEELIKRENQEESRVHTPFLSKLEQVLLAPDKRFKRISDLKEFKEMIESINKMTAIKQLTCTPDNAGKTPLYLAASSKNFSRVKMLLRLGADPLADEHIYSLVFQEAREKDFKNLLNIFSSEMSKSAYSLFVNQQHGTERMTALHRAIITENFARVQTLLDMGADSSIRDKAGKNCLQVAFEKGCGGEMVEKLKNKSMSEGDYDDTLKYISEKTLVSAMAALDLTKRRIELKYTFKRLEILKFVLVTVSSVTGTELLTDEVLKKVIENGDRAVAEIIVRHAKFDEVKAALIKNVDDMILFNKLVIKMPSVAKEAMQRFIEKDGGKFKFDYSCIKFHDIYDDDTRASCLDCLERDVGDSLCNCLQKSSRKRKNRRKKNPLVTMVANDRAELLKHPLVKSYLHTVWNKLGFWFFFFNFSLYCSFLGFLSLFSLTVNNPLLEICNSTHRMVDPVAGDCGSYHKLLFSNFCAAMVIVLAIIHMFKELFQFFNSPQSYIRSWQNGNELLLFPLSIAYVSIFMDVCGCPKDWQWQIGIFVVFFAWINLIIVGSEIPSIGTFIIIFKEIFCTFLKLILFSFVLVLAFSIILFMMFSSPNAEITSFSNIGHSFVKTITMVTGELGFEDIFNLGVSPSEYQAVPFVATNFMMWMVFLVLIPILLNNMLISLAVGDTNKIRERAEIQKVILQINTVVRAYEILPWRVRECFLEWCCVCCCKKSADNRDLLTKQIRNFGKKRKLWRRLTTVVLNFLFGHAEFSSTFDDDFGSYIAQRKKEQEEIKQYLTAGTDFASRRIDQLCQVVETNTEHIRQHLI